MPSTTKQPGGSNAGVSGHGQQAGPGAGGDILELSVGGNRIFLTVRAATPRANRPTIVTAATTVATATNISAPQLMLTTENRVWQKGCSRPELMGGR